MAQTYDFVVTDMALTQAQLKQVNRWAPSTVCRAGLYWRHTLYCLQQAGLKNRS